MFYLGVTSWLKESGVRKKMVFTADQGEGWGGKSWMKIKELKRLN
jgi:hypothetical protein